MLIYGFFFSFKKAHSNCFTNPWILIFIPQIILLFYVLGTIGSESKALRAPNLVEGLDTVSDHLTFLQDHRVRRLVTSGRGALFLEAHPSGPGRLRTSMAVT